MQLTLPKLQLEEVRDLLPKQAGAKLTADVIDKINTTITDPDELKIYKENILTFSTVLNQGRYKLYDYLSAVRFVGFILSGVTNKEAYRITFPDRHLRMVSEGITNEGYNVRVSMYQNSSLVKAIKEKAMIPLYILNMEHRQLAVNRLVQILEDDSVTPKVAVEAADTLLKHLTPPAEVSNAINVVVAGDSTSIINELRDTMNSIANQKKAKIIEHGDIAEIANETYLTYEEE